MAYATAAYIAGAIAVSYAAAVAITVALTIAFTIAGAYVTNAIFNRDQGSTGNLTKRDNIVTARQPTAEWEYVYGTRRKGGTYALMHTTNNNKFLHLIIVLADHLVENIGSIYFGSQVVALNESGNATGTDPNGDNYAGYVRVVKMLGSPDQLALQELIDAAPDKWTHRHRGRGKAYIYVRLKHNNNVFQSLPNISAIVDGKLVYSPRDPEQEADLPSTWKFSSNPADCIADYVADDKIGMDRKGKVVLNEWIAAANACDELVAKKAGGTEKRYECHGIVPANGTHGEKVGAMLTSMVGEVVPTGNRWKLFAGVWRAPVNSISEVDLRGDITAEPKRAKTELFNGGRGLYVSPENEYQSANFPAVTSEALLSEDLGKKRFKEIDLAFTASASAGQRIVKILIYKSRFQEVINWPCKLTALANQAGDNVMVSSAYDGWVDKYFYISRSPIVFDEGLAGTDLTMEETDPAIFDWNSSEEKIIYLASKTSFPNPLNIGPPAGMTITSGDDALLEDSPGHVISQIKIKILPPENSFHDHFSLRYRPETSSDWSSVLVSKDENGCGFHTVSPVVDGITYYFESTSRGRSSGESTALAVQHLVIGKTGDPADVDQFSVSFQSDGTRLAEVKWANVPPDVKNGGGVNLFAKAGTSILPSDFTEENRLNKVGVFNKFPIEFNELEKGIWTLACQVQDSSGNLSPNPKTFTVDLPGLRARGALFDQSERRAGWPGTPANCSVVGDALIPDSLGVINDLPATINALPATILDLVPVAGSISYETTVFDLGGDVTFTPFVSVSASGTVVTEMKTGSDTDGDVTGSYVAAGPVTGVRYVQIRVTVTDAKPIIYDISTIIDGENKRDDFNDLDSLNETAVWFERLGVGHFRVGSRSGEISSITGAWIEGFQAPGTAVRAFIASKSVTVNGEPGAEFETYDTANNLADGVFDLYLKGPKK